jgi:hypothetical protein
MVNGSHGSASPRGWQVGSSGLAGKKEKKKRLWAQGQLGWLSRPNKSCLSSWGQLGLRLSRPAWSLGWMGS